MADKKMAGTAREIGGKIEDAAGNLTGDAETQAQGKVDRVSGKAQTVLGETKKAVLSAASDAGPTFGGMAKRVGSQASDLGGQAYEQGAQAAESLGERIHDKPLAAMLVAGAVGMLIGYLIGRPPNERAVKRGRFRAAYRDR